MSEPLPAALSYAEYLALQVQSDARLEYLDGLVRAMAGGSLEHARLANRFDFLLRSALGDRPCDTFSSDAKIHIRASNRTVYADLTVVCGQLERADTDPEAIANPVMVVEVLSPTTEAYDRGEKFRHYRRLESLREYVLVSQDEPLVEVWRRQGELWKPVDHGAGDVVHLESVGASIAVDVLYAAPLAS